MDMCLCVCVFLSRPVSLCRYTCVYYYLVLCVLVTFSTITVLGERETV